MRIQTLILILALGGFGCASQVGGLAPGKCVFDIDCPGGGRCEQGTCVGGQTGSDGGGVDFDGGATGSDGGATGSDGGTTGSDGGTTGSDGGTTGSDGGTTGSDGGANPDLDGGAAFDGGASTQCHVKGERRACGPDLGTCVPGYQECGGEFWGECIGGTGPAAEECDGLDHDCDGIPNNRVGGCDCTNGEARSCYNGPAGTEGVGTCQAGSQSCVDGQWANCIGAVEPQPGNCAQPSCTGGPNPGCDCTIGETQSCYSGTTGTLGVGTCRGGTQTCEGTASGATWGACIGEQTPAPELCDGRDHDCNGVPNDPAAGCVCGLGDTRACYSGPAGTQGVGTCRAGEQACVLVSSTYNWGACTGDVTPIPGDCNNPSCTGPNDPNPGCDCINGRTRSCYTGPTGTDGTGICHAGMQTCAGGAWGVCSGQQLPGTTDSCVPPTAVYASYTSSDRNCNGSLDRHNPTAAPTLTAPSGQTLAPPGGFVRAIQVQPLDTVTLRGAATDVDGSSTYGYKWRLLVAPQNNTAGLSGAPGATPSDISTQQNPTLFAQLAGDYQVGVRAVDASGCNSAEVKVLIRVQPHTAIHLQLTWDRSVDVDLQLVQGSTTAIFGANACYWGDLNPNWGTIDPSLDIDDLAGCNPENINYGAIGGAPPPEGSSYSVFVHYYCNRRGHRFTFLFDPTAVCYEPTAQGATSPTLKVFVNGQLAQVEGTGAPAEFTTSLSNWGWWKPVTLHYEGGLWKVRAATGTTRGSSNGCPADSGSSDCVCGQLPNSSDPYCGSSGAACRQRFP